MPQTILVVDDEPDVLLLCKVNLEFEGYEVLEAHDGEEALERINMDHPDLILLDVMMPGMDGWQVLSAVMSDPSTSEIPVVMLTAKVQEGDQMRGLTDGAADYVTKPFNPIALSRTVKEALTASSAGQLQRKRQQMLDKLRLIQGF